LNGEKNADENHDDCKESQVLGENHIKWKLDLNVVDEALVNIIKKLLGLERIILLDSPEVFSLIEITLTL